MPKVDLKNNHYNKSKKISDINNAKENYLFDINDKEEENIKEITNLMKKMNNE